MPASGTTLRKIWWWVGALGVAAVIYLSLTPSPPEIDLGRYSDKWEHFAAYATLMLWFCQIRRSWRQRLLLLALFAGLGVGLEFVQRAGGVRSFEIADMEASVLGVLAGWLLAPPRLPNWFDILNRLLGAREVAR